MGKTLQLEKLDLGFFSSPPLPFFPSLPFPSSLPFPLFLSLLSPLPFPVLPFHPLFIFFFCCHHSYNYSTWKSGQNKMVIIVIMKKQECVIKGCCLAYVCLWWFLLDPWQTGLSRSSEPLVNGQPVSEVCNRHRHIPDFPCQMQRAALGVTEKP